MARMDGKKNEGKNAMTKSNLVRKWKTCPKFKNNMLYSGLTFLGGCVTFWNLRCHKLVRQVNRDYGFLTPEQLNGVAWTVNGVAKTAAVGLFIKALFDYKKC